MNSQQQTNRNTNVYALGALPFANYLPHQALVYPCQEERQTQNHKRCATSKPAYIPHCPQSCENCGRAAPTSTDTWTKVENELRHISHVSTDIQACKKANDMYALLTSVEAESKSEDRLPPGAVREKTLLRQLQTMAIYDTDLRRREYAHRLVALALKFKDGSHEHSCQLLIDDGQKFESGRSVDGLRSGSSSSGIKSHLSKERRELAVNNEASRDIGIGRTASRHGRQEQIPSSQQGLNECPEPNPRFKSALKITKGLAKPGVGASPDKVLRFSSTKVILNCDGRVEKGVVTDNEGKSASVGLRKKIAVLA